MAILDQLSSGYLTSRGTASTSATGSIANAAQADSSFFTSKGVSPNTGSGAGVGQADSSFFTSKGITSSSATGSLAGANSSFLTSKGVNSYSTTGSLAKVAQASSGFYTSKGIGSNTSLTGSGVSVSQAGSSFYTSKGISSGQTSYLKAAFNAVANIGGFQSKSNFNFVPPSAPASPVTPSILTTENSLQLITEAGSYIITQ